MAISLSFLPFIILSPVSLYICNNLIPNELVILSWDILFCKVSFSYSPGNVCTNLSKLDGF